MIITNHGHSPLPAFLRAAEKARSHLLADAAARHTPALDTRRAMDVLAESLGREADPIDRRNREDAEGAAMEGDRWE